MRVFLQVYKELELAIQLGSEYAQKLLKHPNVVVSAFTFSHLNLDCRIVVSSVRAIVGI